MESLREGRSVVSIHLTLNPSTAGLIDASRLALPKRGFVLVNTARFQIVSEAALWESLDNGQIGHAALDVFDQEPLPAGHPLKARKSVTLTAHAAYMTDDAYAESWRRATAALTGVG
jgi:D-3-phosphoglycerate dehydrogenase